MSDSPNLHWALQNCYGLVIIPATSSLLSSTLLEPQYTTIKACSHGAKAKKIKEQSEDIKEKNSNIQENFCIRSVWIHPYTKYWVYSQQLMEIHFMVLIKPLRQLSMSPNILKLSSKFKSHHSVITIHLQKGNVFTPVYDSVHSGDVCLNLISLDNTDV